MEGTVAFGTVQDSDSDCINYKRFVDAKNAYTSGTGKSLPFSELKVSINVPTLAFGYIGRSLGVPEDGFVRVPFAPYQQVMVPNGYVMSDSTAKHEFAHTVRHTLDGSLAHWTIDAGRFRYPRTHYCDLKTNEGFAFNEGWCSSFYWS